MHVIHTTREDDRNAVEVALGNTRGTEVRGDAATEHVGEAATASACAEG